MKNAIQRLITIFCGLIILSLIVSSCIKEEYDFSKDKLDLTIKVGGDSLLFPLGSTAQLTISSLLKQEDIDFLKKDVTGKYSLEVEQKVNVASAIPDFDPIKVDPISISTSFDQTVGSFNQNDYSISGSTINENIDPGFTNINLDEVGVTFDPIANSIALEIYKYAPEDLTLPLSPMVLSAPRLYTLSQTTINTIRGNTLIPDPLDVSSYLSSGGTFDAIKDTIKYTLSFPEGVTNVRNIVLKPGAKFIIEMEVIGAATTFESGTFTPNITLKPSDLFIFESASNPIILGASEKLDNTTTKKYYVKREYPIKGLNITAAEWEGNILKLKKELGMQGEITCSGLIVKKANLEGINNIGLDIKVSISGLEIESADLDIPTIKDSVKNSINVPISFDIPSQVKSIDSVVFKSTSAITLAINVDNISTLAGVDLVLDKLVVKFPEEFVVTGADAQNRFIINNKDLNGIAPIKIPVKSINFATIPITNGTVSKDFAISSEVFFKASGSLSTANIPKTAAQDVKIRSNISSNVTFKDCFLKTNDVTQSVATDPFPISIAIPNSIISFGSVDIKPVGSPAIALNLSLPSLPLNITTGAAGILINLPDLFTFKDVDPIYEYSRKYNTIKIVGTIPNTIDLPIDSILFNPVTVDGQEMLQSSFSVIGGIVIKSGAISLSDYNTLHGKKIGVDFTYPAITPETITLERFSVDVEEQSFEMPLKFEDDFLKHIHSIDSLIVKNANLAFTVLLDKIPNFGTSPILLNAKIKFPKSFIFKDSRINAENEFVIHNARIVNNKFSIDPVKVIGVKFDGKPINGVIDATDYIKVHANITVNKPSVTLSELQGDNISVKINGGLGELLMSKVYCRVKYTMDKPESFTFPLNEIPNFMKSPDFVLDFDNPRLEMVLETNLGIPINADLSIKPYVGGVVNNAGVQDISLTIPKFNSIAKMDSIKYWVAKDNVGMGSGYNFIQSPIGDLIKKIPDSLKLAFNVSTDISEQHVFDFNANYDLKARAKFTIPISFGKDFNISFKDTIKGIPDEIANIIRESELGLVGTIENSFPLQFEFTIAALDENMAVIPGIQSTTQRISGCDGTEVPKVSILNLKLSDSSKSVKKIGALELRFRVSAPNTSGRQINEQCYIRAVLKAKVKGGLTINPNNK